MKFEKMKYSKKLFIPQILEIEIWLIWSLKSIIKWRKKSFF